MQLRRYLVLQSEGVSNDYTCPDWYGHIQAAKYLGVAPWDLLKASFWWRDKAIIAMSAEEEANNIIKERNRNKLG